MPGHLLVERKTRFPRQSVTPSCEAPEAAVIPSWKLRLPTRTPRVASGAAAEAESSPVNTVARSADRTGIRPRGCGRDSPSDPLTRGRRVAHVEPQRRPSLGRRPSPPLDVDPDPIEQWLRWEEQANLPGFRTSLLPVDLSVAAIPAERLDVQLADATPRELERRLLPARARALPEAPAQRGPERRLLRRAGGRDLAGALHLLAHAGGGRRAGQRAVLRQAADRSPAPRLPPAREDQAARGGRGRAALDGALRARRRGDRPGSRPAAAPRGDRRAGARLRERLPGARPLAAPGRELLPPGAQPSLVGTADRGPARRGLRGVLGRLLRRGGRPRQGEAADPLRPPVRHARTPRIS